MEASPSHYFQFKVNDFEVSINLYIKNAVIIVHKECPGFGSIIQATKSDSTVDLDQLLGPQTDIMNLLANQLFRQFSIPSITFIFSFKPDNFTDFKSVRAFLDGFIQNMPKF